MRITVSGLPGSGTTSLARHLASTQNYTLISAGEVFRQMAGEKGLDIAEFGRIAEKNPSIDREIDARQREIAEARDDIIAEGRLSGWCVRNADLRIWLQAPMECRVERIFSRDTIVDIDTALSLTREREASEARRYREYYSIDINDLSLYHMVLNSAKFGVEDLSSLVETAISRIEQAKTVS
ncbi:MAG: cytidylate kinase [Methanoregulaceae archaeon PtaU1.Bin059]|jgi:cytidylate kinase|nr:MAG: cytidylate kinase [Methanoregulaceae archaeon PtaB.Bin009]OPY39451.1 MAG: cytidylate kinase [Methanoregulaceae archaeon PtaU1.Bin059]HNQ30698.1 AAA family ATPase [Methanolinea sp.]HNS82778.1 AAA family ATPase [Methanolinea sp.]